jgi:hypothetical protein
MEDFEIFGRTTHMILCWLVLLHRHLRDVVPRTRETEGLSSAECCPPEYPVDHGDREEIATFVSRILIFTGNVMSGT